MTKGKVCAFLFIFIVNLQDVVFCSIIDNITHKSVTSEIKGEIREISGKNTTPILSTRSNFISASTVLNPPNSATEPVDWTLENFRKWVNVNYSRRPAGLLSIPDERVRLNSPRARSVPPVRDEYEDIYAEDLQHYDAGASRGHENEVSSYYLFKNQKRGSQEIVGPSRRHLQGKENVVTGRGPLRAHEDENNTVDFPHATNHTEEMTEDTAVKAGQ